MNNKLEKIWKESDMGLFGVFSQNSPGVTEGN
jgi:hypothetical protein